MIFAPAAPFAFAVPFAPAVYPAGPIITPFALFACPGALFIPARNYYYPGLLFKSDEDAAVVRVVKVEFGSFVRLIPSRVVFD